MEKNAQKNLGAIKSDNHCGASTADEFVKFEGRTVEFCDRDPPYKVLQNIYFSVHKCEFVSVVGRSGSGKTTLLRDIAALLRLRQAAVIEGNLEVLGGPPENARLNRQIAIVTQQPRLFLWMTVFDNICFPQRIIGKRPNGYRNPKELVRLMGIEAHADHMPRTLSGGEQQRVSIARALFYNPELLLLDEPFGSLDAITREQLSLDLKSIVHQMGITTVFVTHDLREALFLSDKVVILAPLQSPDNNGPHTVVKKVVEVPFPKKRSLDLKQTPQFNNLEKELKDLL